MLWDASKTSLAPPYLAQGGLDACQEAVELAGELADLILAGNAQAPGQVTPPLGHALGNLVHVGGGLTNLAHRTPGDPDGKEGNGQVDGRGNEEQANQRLDEILPGHLLDHGHGGIHPGGVDASTDHPVPLGDGGGVGVLGLHLAGGRVGPLVGIPPASAACDLDHVTDQRLAVGVLHIQHVAPLLLGHGRLDQHGAVVVEDEDIVVLLETQLAQQAQGHLLRHARIVAFVADALRQGSGHTDDAFDPVAACLEHQLALLRQLRAVGIDALECFEDQQAGRRDDQGHQDQEQNLVLQIQGQQLLQAGETSLFGRSRFHGETVIISEKACGYLTCHQASRRSEALVNLILMHGTTSSFIDPCQFIAPSHPDCPSHPVRGIVSLGTTPFLALGNPAQLDGWLGGSYV